MALSDRVRRFSGVVSLKGLSKSDLNFKMAQMKVCFEGLEASRFAFILHDRDTDEDDKLKTPHIHFYLNTRKAIRISTMINSISSSLDVSPFAVSCQGCSSENSVVQYLIHKNDPLKFQYPMEEVINNFGEGELQLVMESKEKEFSFDYLCTLCASSDSLLEVIQAVGLSRYHGYRNTILDIWKVFHSDK